MAKSFYEVKKQMDGVYSLTNCVTCMYLVIGREKALVFDTGYGFADCLPEIRKLTDKPLVVVDSHGHFDHISGNYLFGCPVYISEKDMETVGRHSSPEYRKIPIESISKIEKLVFWKKWIPKELDREGYINREPFNDYIFVSEGEVFDLGDVTLEVVEMPGHTPGSIALYCKEKRLMLVSDATNPMVFLFLPESTKLSVYINSVKHALEKDFDYFVTGHIPKLLPKSDMETYLRVAENMDWENGKSITHHMRPGVEIRQCTEKGKKPGKHQPYITISLDKIDR